MTSDQPAPSSDALDLYVINLDSLHHVQRDILTQLYTVASAPYSDLKPPELTGNAFNYHLRQALAQRLIIQTPDNRYALTPRGRLLVDNVSLPSMKLKLRPVVGAALVLHSDAYGVLLYRANREPLRGFAGMPFGKLRLGDSLEATLGRMVTRRRLDAIAISKLRPLGFANVRYFDAGELISHRLTAVWSGHYVGRTSESRSSHGYGFWSQRPESEPDVLVEAKAFANWPPTQSFIELSQQL